MGAILSFFKSFYSEQTFWKEAESIDFDLTPKTEIPARLDAILKSLKEYKGCASYIKDSISNPSPENDSKTWKNLHPCVLEIRKFYEISLEIGIAFSLMLESSFYQIVKKVSATDVVTNLDSQRPDLENLAEFLEFCAEFDFLKVGNPSLQNDFSYYRRSMSKIKGSTEVLIL